MPNRRYPVGLSLRVAFDPFSARLTLISESRLRFEIEDGPFARSETVDIQVTPIGDSLFLVSWQEQSGATVTHIQDFDREVIHSHATLPDGRFLRMTGPMTIVTPAEQPSDERPQRNKALVLDAMTSLFQRRDASAVDRLYVEDYVQHNPHIPQGRAALKALVASLSNEVWYEPGLILAEGDFVAIHGRIRGWADRPQVVVDLFRIEGGRLAEHWDVLQDEVSADLGLSPSMFDPHEAPRAPTIQVPTLETP
ncbi:nuclear transport factor 2 family protein [Phenylobacterium sp.]|uniref:nuclear transport factor 2 family protein n=1 Tax=Phenylobacterium sp. TaxID=1871053 RepID=UPI002730D115|nr:nuclear transport factor 2 family protein [Phenylobacterium sp.]MDP1617564.1 nuclear transport factor 2 family protein [Phenylobacterium sp.]MDP1986742.1 nuclear transport factor 2 family protein [Phenylobacterium sp.]